MDLYIISFSSFILAAAQKNFLHISRAHDHEPRCYFSPNEGLNRYCISKLYNLNKMSRYVLPKSELAGTGTPDASYSLSGFHGNLLSH